MIHSRRVSVFADLDQDSPGLHPTCITKKLLSEVKRKSGLPTSHFLPFHLVSPRNSTTNCPPALARLNVSLQVPGTGGSHEGGDGWCGCCRGAQQGAKQRCRRCTAGSPGLEFDLIQTAIRAPQAPSKSGFASTDHLDSGRFGEFGQCSQCLLMVQDLDVFHVVLLPCFPLRIYALMEATGGRVGRPGSVWPKTVGKHGSQWPLLGTSECPSPSHISPFFGLVLKQDLW